MTFPFSRSTQRTHGPDPMPAVNMADQMHELFETLIDAMNTATKELVADIRKEVALDEPTDQETQPQGGENRSTRTPAPRENLVRGLTPKQLADFQRSTDSFKRGRPHFHMGDQTFSQFMEYFDIALKEAQFEPPIEGPGAIEAVEAEKKVVYKRLLFNSLAGEARKLASRRANPETCPEMAAKSYTGYAEKLRLLFEPPSESEASRQEFLSRRQQRGENPLMYFSDKIALWERAWSIQQRDIVTLLDETTAGLLNEDLRREMRRSQARTEADYDRDLRFAVNSIRKQLLAGELEHNDGAGLELQSSTMSYLGGRQDLIARAPKVKEEPVYAVTHTNTAKVRRCFHCQQKGHFVADCPRKSAGLPAIHAAEPESGTDGEGDGGEESFTADSDEAAGERVIAALRSERPARVARKSKGKRVRFAIPNRQWRQWRAANRRQIDDRSPPAGGGASVVTATAESSGENEAARRSLPPSMDPMYTVRPENSDLDYADFLDFSGL